MAALAGLICVAASGVILVALHFLPTGLDPPLVSRNPV